MKNELMARAMTEIDLALIEEAEEMPKAKILTPDLLSKLTRYGSLAACLVLVFGALLVGRLSAPELLLYGEEVTGEARMVTEFIPRAVTYSVDPAQIAQENIPLELDFKRETHLTLECGEMVVLDSEGNEIYCGTEYSATGETSLCLSVPESETNCVIATDRGYNIVLSKDTDSGIWYVNIEK